MDWIIFFRVFLSSKEVFFSFYEILPEQIFNNAVQTNVFILIRKFADKYKKVPDCDTLMLLLESLPESEKPNRQTYLNFIEAISAVDSTTDVDIFKEHLTKAIQDYEIEQFILRSANKVGTVSPEDLLVDLRNVMTKFTPKSVGVDITNVDKAMKLMRHDPSERVSTGIHDLDKVLYGGYGSDEIFIVMAPPGKGKSYFLINAMYYAMLAGKNPLYITLELVERAVLRRFYSRVSFASKKDMLDEEAISQRTKKFFTLVNAQGRVNYFPGASLTVAGIESLLEQQKLYFNFKPDIIIVDYLDRLAPRRNDLKGDTRHQLRNITDDLRSLAIKYNTPMISATQANRASLSKLKITEAHVSESFGKIEVADVVVALCQTDEEKAAHRARLSVLKNRDYISGSTIEFYVDFDKMFLSDLQTAHRLGLLQESVVAEPAKQEQVDLIKVKSHRKKLEGNTSDQ